MSILAQIYKKKTVYLFLFPTFILLLVFGYYPPVSALLHAFTDWNGSAADFNGIQNFIDIIHDTAFIESISNLVLLLIAGIVTSNVLSIIAAELIFNLKDKYIKEKYKFLFTIPMLVPSVVVILVWANMIFEPNSGLLNQILKLFKLEPLGWLGEPSTALVSLIFYGFPWISGINFLVYLAGLQNISTSVIESSELDGAVGLKRFFNIDMPLIRGQIKIMVMLGVIWGIQGFQLQMLISSDGQGGPAKALMVPGLWMYQNAFYYGKFGYASAIGLVLFVSIFLLTVINMKLIKTNNEV